MSGFNPQLLFTRHGRRARLEGIAERLEAATTAAQVARVLVEETSATTAAVTSILYLLAPDADHLRVAASRGLSPSTGRRLATVPLTCPLPFATAVLAGRALWFRDRGSLLAEFPDFYGQFPDGNVHALAVLPLRVGEGVLGSLAIGPAQPGRLSDDDLEFLMVAVDAGARALARLPVHGWGRRWLAPPALTADSSGDASLSFVPCSGPPGWPRLRRRHREGFDLTAAVRLVARRHLPGFRHARRSLRCEMAAPVLGVWDRRAAERMIGGLLSLALHLVPHAPIVVHVCGGQQQAVVEARYALDDGPAVRADLAHLTRAREEWELDFWLWRALARAGGGRLSLMQDQRGPVGIRLLLPS